MVEDVLGFRLSCMCLDSSVCLYCQVKRQCPEFFVIFASCLLTFQSLLVKCSLKVSGKMTKMDKLLLVTEERIKSSDSDKHFVTSELPCCLGFNKL